MSTPQLQDHAPEIEILEGYEAPPNSFKDENGKQAGLLIDIAKEIEKQLGIKLKRKNFNTWKELMDDSLTGRNFLIVGIAETDERAEYLKITLSSIADAVLSTDENGRIRIMNARKMESLGVLAGGIAHDFNNLLTGIFGFIELARGNVVENSPAARYLDKAILSLENSSGLTNQLLTFSKGGDPVRKELTLGPVIEENSRFCLHGSKVKLKMEIAPDLDEIVADKGQIGQVISNLVINAQQAMSAGGTLTISAENTRSDEENYVRIIIRVESRYGEGTQFTILLPSERGTVTRKSKDDVQWTQGTSETAKDYKILVLDDEPFIREYLETILTDHGYRVKCASEGRVAVKIYREALARGETINLVISDLTIPGELGGKETAAEILKIDPGACIIIASGYSNDPVMAKYKEYGFKGVVTKPFNAGSLFNAIDKALKKES